MRIIQIGKFWSIHLNRGCDRPLAFDDITFSHPGSGDSGRMPMAAANSRNKPPGRPIEMGDASELLRLANALHTPHHPAERKRQLLRGLASLVGANSGISLVRHRKRDMQPILISLPQPSRGEKSRASSAHHRKKEHGTAPSSTTDLLTSLTNDAMAAGKASAREALFGDRAVLFSTLTLDHQDMLAGVAFSRRAGAEHD